MRYLFIIFLLLIFALPETVYPHNFPVFNRLSGLIDIPTCEILQDGTVCYGLHGASSNEKDGEGFEWDGNLWFGLAERVEFGITLLERERVCGNAKFLLVKEEVGIPGIAVGIENLGLRIQNIYGEEYEGEENSIYAVMSKSFGRMKGHIGVGGGRFVGHGPISKYLHGLFIGVERELLVRGPQSLKAILEFSDGRDTNVGLRFTIPEGLRIELAITEIDNLLGKHEDLVPAYSLGATWITPLKGWIEIRPKEKRVVIPIRERARMVEEEVVKKGVITHPPERFLSSRNLRVWIRETREDDGYVVVDLLLMNVGNEPIYTNPNYFVLVNRDGEEFYYSPKTFLITNSFLGGRVWPGERIEGVLAFPFRGIPKELIYNDGWENLVVKRLR